jgi:hypothetical protein
MKVPEQVKTAAQSLIDIYGDSFDYLGKYKGRDAFLFRFPEDSCTGFPFVYLFAAGKVTEITGFKAILLVENFDEVNVE